jgi:hypothetical protein
VPPTQTLGSFFIDWYSIRHHGRLGNKKAHEKAR